MFNGTYKKKCSVLETTQDLEKIYYMTFETEIS